MLTHPAETLEMPRNANLYNDIHRKITANLFEFQDRVTRREIWSPGVQTFFRSKSQNLG